MKQATTDCKKCILRYSSYCLGCSNVKQGLNLSDAEYAEYLKKTSQPPTERKRGKRCKTIGLN